jgi:hypothetical protein
MKCDKCKKEIESKWKSGETYEGIDYHHNPPQFMVNEWHGKIYALCRKCHTELHKEIRKILNEVAETLKFVNSEHWVWIKMSPIKQWKAVDEITKFTEVWINGNS